MLIASRRALRSVLVVVGSICDCEDEFSLFGSAQRTSGSGWGKLRYPRDVMLSGNVGLGVTFRRLALRF